MPWVVFAGVTAAALCSWLMLVRRVAESMANSEAGPASSYASRLRARIVFSCRDDDVVTIDCVVVEDEPRGRATVPAGLPFTIIAELPVSQEWAGLAASDVLDQWAADGRALAVDIVDGATGAAVRISDDDTRLQLGIAA